MSKDKKEEIKYEVLSENFDLSEYKKANIISWNEGKPAINIRNYRQDRPSNGVSISLEEAESLQECLSKLITALEKLETKKPKSQTVVNLLDHLTGAEDILKARKAGTITWKGLHLNNKGQIILPNRRK